jgi:tRNA splicing endonuclease
MIIEIGLHQHEPERRRCEMIFFYHRAREEGTEVAEGFRWGCCFPIFNGEDAETSPA